jgi:hypothetical protein
MPAFHHRSVSGTAAVFHQWIHAVRTGSPSSLAITRVMFQESGCVNAIVSAT